MVRNNKIGDTFVGKLSGRIFKLIHIAPAGVASNYILSNNGTEVKLSGDKLKLLFEKVEAQP